MNSKKLLYFLLLVVLLFAVVRAEDEEEKDVGEVEVDDAEEQNIDEPKEQPEEEQEDPEPVPEPKEPTPEPEPKEPTPEPVKPEPKPNHKTTPVKSKPSPTPKPVVNKPTDNKPQNPSNGQNKPVPAPTPAPINKGNTTPSKPATSNNTKSNDNTAAAAPAKNEPAAQVNGASQVAFKVTASSAAAPTGGAILPQANPVSGSSNISADGNVKKEEEGGNNIVKGTVISLVAVGAVVGVATVGVRAYNKKTNDSSRGADLGDIEAQPIKNDFGNTNEYDNGDYMAPEEYNPYNIMNDVPNEPYVTNNPYEYKPSYDENVIDTTPFNKVETTQDNFMSRESIFSTSGNIPQIGNDVFNFSDNTQLPYQEHPVENAYIEEPVANEIKIENYEAPSSQMPTLVPVQPEIVITQPDEEPAQEGYKQIVPTVAQMEIIETPDFNNMTTSMIEDHIKNMDLEQLANTETQQEEPDGGYKQIVPDIQEAVIENFEVEDDEEDPDMSVVDNITDTYRAALRATYCSTTDDNRFSYRTVDSDHSLLHTMRENGEW